MENQENYKALTQCLAQTVIIHTHTHTYGLIILTYVDMCVYTMYVYIQPDLILISLSQILSSSPNLTVSPAITSLLNNSIFSSLVYLPTPLYKVYIITTNKPNCDHAHACFPSRQCPETIALGKHSIITNYCTK